MHAATQCPECGSREVAEILYGLPTREAAAAADRGEIALGGCFFNWGSARWRCLTCNAEWGVSDEAFPYVTPEQRARLALIENDDQREALLDAIAKGEEIPDFAWTPLPPMGEREHRIIADLADEIRRRWGDEGLRKALDPNLFNNEDER